jgi:hypothetical protein
MPAATRIGRWFLLTVTFLVLWTALGSETVRAQNVVADVRSELRATDAVLLKARRLVIDQNCPSQRARDLLFRARDVQERAWEAFGNNMSRAALKTTLRARDLAREAIKIAERWNYVKRHIQKTADLIELATEMLTAHPDPQAALLLESAVGQFERGKEALRSGQIEQAYSLLKNANRLARDIISRLEEHRPGGDRVLREMERTDRLIGKAAPAIAESGDQKAQALLERGRQIQSKAYDVFQQSRYQLAYGLTMEARKLTAKAWAMVTGPVSPERVRQALAATDELIDRIRPAIMESGRQEAIELFQSAVDHQEKATAALAEEHYKIALAQTKIARRLVDRSLEMVQGD